MALSKSWLAILLSKVAGFPKADTKKEQYQTDSEIAAEVLWHAYMAGDIKNLSILDAGCGIGSTSVYLSEKYENSTFFGIMLTKSELEIANKLKKQKNWIICIFTKDLIWIQTLKKITLIEFLLWNQHAIHQIKMCS
jgi:predicted RNA methylase